MNYLIELRKKYTKQRVQPLRRCDAFIINNKTINDPSLMALFERGRQNAVKTMAERRANGL
jgi:hypothetical protein